MNILEINTIDIRGGAARVAYNLKTELEKRNHNVSLFVDTKLSQDSQVQKIPKAILGKYLSYAFANDTQYFNSDWILGTKQFEEADVVHCHNLHGRYFNLDTLQKMAEQKPVVWTLHDMWAITPHCAHAFGGRIKGGFFQCPSKDIYPALLWHNELSLEQRKRNIYEHSDFTLVTPSKWLQNKVAQSVLQNKNTHFIPNGIDTSIFYPRDKGEMRRKLGLPVDKKIVIFTADGGTGNPWKGWHFVEAVTKSLANRSDLLFLCIGGGAEARVEGRVHYVPYVSEQGVLAQYLGASDILLFTSVAENFPLAVLEAIACSLPVVSFDVGGVKEAISHLKNGYIAKYKDAVDLIVGTEYVLDLSEAERSRMSQAAVDVVGKRYTVERMVDAYLSLYNELLHEPLHRGSA